MTSSTHTPNAARSPLATQGLGVAYATGAIISAQFGAALAKQLMGDLGPWGVVTLRLLTSSVLLWAFFRPQIRSWTRQQWMTVIVLGIALTGANAFFYVAIEQVPLAIAVAIEFMGPLVLATVMSRRKLDLVWIALSFTGMAILTAESQAKPEDFALMGVIFSVLTAVSRAAYILATEKVGALIPGMGGMVMGNVVSTLLVLPFPFLISGNNLLKVTQDVNLLAIGCLMGLLASALPALSLEPAIAAAVGIVMLGEATGLVRWVAIALLVAASIGISISHARAQKKAQEDGTMDDPDRYLPGAVDAHAVDIAQMATSSITLPSATQIKADREAKGL